MIRPEAHQYNWKPKTRSKDDMKLVKELETIRKKSGMRKNELTRIALYFYAIDKPKSNQEVK